MVDVIQAENAPDNQNGTEEQLASPESQDANTDIPGDAGQAESEEFEVVLSSTVDQPSTDKKDRKPKGIKKLLAKNRKKDDEIAELQRQLAESQQGNAQPTPRANAMPIAPTSESVGYDDGALVQANQKYQQDMAAYQQDATASTVRAMLDEQQNGTRRAREQEQHTSVIEKHYERAEALKVPDFDVTEGKVIDILDQGAVTQIAQMVPNSEALVYFLGKNPDEAYKLRELWEQNPGAVGFRLGELSKDLKVVRKGTKQRPAPESRVTSAAPKSSSSLEREIEAERELIYAGKKDFSQLQELKRLLKRAN